MFSLQNRFLPVTAVTHLVADSVTQVPVKRPDDPPHLVLRKGSSKYYAKVRVPPSLGWRSQHIVKSLGTSSRAEAMRRLPVVVAEIRKEIEAARRDLRLPQSNH